MNFTSTERILVARNSDTISMFVYYKSGEIAKADIACLKYGGRMIIADSTIPQEARKSN